MADLTEALTRAVDRHQAGDLDSAEQAYRVILENQPDHADALHLLGLVLYQKGDPAQATDLITG